MSTPSKTKRFGRYFGRVSPRVSTDGSNVALWSATVIYVDENGIEHPTGYEHPTYPRRDGNLAYFELAQTEIDDMADGYQDFLRLSGFRWEQLDLKSYPPSGTKLPFFADIAAGVVEGDLRVADGRAVH